MSAAALEIVVNSATMSFSVLLQALYFRSSPKANPANMDLRIKAQTYAFNITNSPNLVLANMTFFGTTINAKGVIPYLKLDTLDLRFPSTSRRMLGDIHTAAPTVLVAESGTRSAHRDGLLPEDSSFIIYNCSWT